MLIDELGEITIINHKILEKLHSLRLPIVWVNY